MTGPDHFRKAEEILAELEQHAYSDGTEIGLAVRALTHATLANAAAAALGASGTETQAWAEVAAARFSPDRS